MTMQDRRAEAATAKDFPMNYTHIYLYLLGEQQEERLELFRFNETNILI